MTPVDDELPRWRETSMDPRALSARAADLADAARDVPSLPPEALARIKVDVLARRPSRGRALPFSLRFAMLAAVLLTGAATAKGTMLLWRRYVAPAPVTAPQRATHRAQAVAVAPVIEPMEAPAPVEAVEVAAPVIAPARVRRSAAAPHPTLSPPGRGLEEAQLLGDALSKLRQGHDPRGALALLDQYAKAFPRGVLASEARSARLEAVLQQGDRATALVLLDERTTFAGRLGAEQLLTRAELRASASRYVDALADFDRVMLPGAVSPADVERALYGRAVSLGHLHRDARARADLVDYQRRFPGGKHAAEVARLLKGTTASDQP